MGFICFELWSAPVTPQPVLLKATPTLQPEFPAEPARPRIRTTKSLPLITTRSQRPIYDDFPKPKRTRSLPSVVNIGFPRRWNIYNKLSRTLITTTDKQEIDHRDSQEKMAAALIRNRMVDDFRKMSSHNWFSLSYSREILKNEEDVQAVLEQAKQNHPEWKSTIPTLMAFFCEDAPQLFTMLIYNRGVEMLDQFCHHGMDDSVFPVNFVQSEDSIESTNEGKPTKLKLDISLASDMCESWQWKFFVPRLCWAPFNVAALDARCKLPYVEPLNLEKNKIHGSDFSIVYKGIAHRDYITVESNGIELATNKDGHFYVAVKQLLSINLPSNSSEDFIKVEHETLEKLRNFDSSHLIKALAFYKQKTGTVEQLFFVFPWAEHGNLRQFWAEKIPSIHDNNYMQWIFHQLVGLADAIYTLHHEEDTSYRHGDLKPENILCFNTSRPTIKRDQTSCIFVITDVGLSRSHAESTAIRSRTKLMGGETAAYAAPETTLFPNRSTTRRFDIWSLGCLYMEFVIWLLYRINGLDRFREEIGIGQQGRFYIITSSPIINSTDNQIAQINPVVTKWISHIKRDPRCAAAGSNETAIGRLINLIEKRLLVVKADPPTERLKPGDEDQAIPDSGDDIGNPMIKFSRATTLSPDSQNRMSSKMAEFANVEEERAYAPEARDKLDEIIRDVDAGSIKWLNVHEGLATDNGPEPSTNLPIHSRIRPEGTNQDFDNRWEYIPDKDAANRLQATLTQVLQLRKPSELCGRCRNLPLWSQECTFIDTATGLTRNSIRCVLCRLLSEALKSWDIIPDDNLHFFRTGSSLKFNDEAFPSIASLYTLPQYLEAFNSNIQMGFPELPNPGDQIHSEVIRQWIRECDDTHKTCLQPKEIPFLPTRLLYVGKHGSEQPRLICETHSLSEGTNYLALSHRWGSKPKEGEIDPLEGKIVCSYKKNIEQLELGVDESMLPAMYLDAISIAREVKVDYIWIDSLCIIQKDMDDPSDTGEDWKKEAERMEQVYRSAYFTIAASCAASTAEHFLKAAPKRQSIMMNKDDASYYVCENIDDFKGHVEDGELNKRAWVLQERALSRRTVYFADKQTYWECGEGVRCETLTRVKNSKASFLGDVNFPYSFPKYIKGQKIALYQELYQRYSKLALTYDTDRPMAIKGLERRLLGALGSQGGFGILDTYLRRSLLWQRDTVLKRIKFSHNTEQEAVPSWSWMAYAGEIRYMHVPGGAEWAKWEQDIVSPWRTARNKNERLQLEVLVRDLEDNKRQQRALIFRDEPGRTLDSSSFKCVIVGSSNPFTQTRGREYYVLLVTLLGQRDSNIYERAGVGRLYEQEIVWNKPAIKGYIR